MRFWVDESNVRAPESCNSLTSFLPSSTPNWSKELMFQIQPSTATECSYIASRRPRERGVSWFIRIVVEGRLPGKLRGGIVRFLAFHQRRRLREGVESEDALLAGGRVFRHPGGFGEDKEFGRDDFGALVEQLEEGVLHVRARLAEDDEAV